MVKTPFREFKATVNKITCHLQKDKLGDIYYDCNIHLSDEFHRKKYREFLFSKRSPFITNNYDEITIEGFKPFRLHLDSSDINLGEWETPLECVSRTRIHEYKEKLVRFIRCKKPLSFGEWVKEE